jgi:hypothetical protein
MPLARELKLFIGGKTLPLPCFFPSISSIKTNLLPVDYLELLCAIDQPMFLISAYDIYNASAEHQQRMEALLKKATENGASVLLDSGNYECFWRGDTDWTIDHYSDICRKFSYNLCFCFDNQEPPSAWEEIADDVIRSVLRDQDICTGTVVPILHGPSNLLPLAARKIAEVLCPILLAVPERALGDGILRRARAVMEIRRELDSLTYYLPLHLLGTGNPLSILIYTLAGSDSYDGLEWCQTVVDHNDARLYHFHHWDIVAEQTPIGNDQKIPFIQSALIHNLTFYNKWLEALRDAIAFNQVEDFIIEYLPARILGKFKSCLPEVF